MKMLSDLGERKAIDLVADIFDNKNMPIGIGDDCAAIEFGEKYLLVTTDMISQKTHIPKQMTPYQIGWFIVAINLSDIAAKGGSPYGLVLSFGLPKNTKEKFLKGLAEGANSCANKFDTSIVGGDMKETSEITLTGTAFGIVKKEEFMPRIGAKVGDMVAVTGSLGKAGLGHYCLGEKISENKFSQYLFEPIPRLKEGRILAQEKCITSCMDISDGLSSSLYQLSKLNNVGYEINYNSIPLSQGLKQLHTRKKNLDIHKIAFNYGGDYELIITIPINKFKIVQEKLRRIGCKLTDIGRVTNENRIVISQGEVKKPLENLGYEHFKKHIF